MKVPRKIKAAITVVCRGISKKRRKTAVEALMKAWGEKRRGANGIKSISFTQTPITFRQRQCRLIWQRAITIQAVWFYHRRKGWVALVIFNKTIESSSNF